jgi:hypothetical protein
MRSHVDFGHQLLAFPKVQPELQKEALKRIVVTLDVIASTLSPSLVIPVGGKQ